MTNTIDNLGDLPTIVQEVAKLSVFPHVIPLGPDGEAAHVHGLTKRELFAAMAMQGLLSNWEALARMGFKVHELNTFAIERADELLKQLSK